MANSLLFTLWANGNNIVLGPRWTSYEHYQLFRTASADIIPSGYSLPSTYAGPKVTLLPSSTVNSTHVKATFRCQVSGEHCLSLIYSHLNLMFYVQNCTTWAGGSLGSGDLTSYQVLAYVVGTSSTPANVADAASTIQQHDYFNFLGVDLSAAHDPNYSAYINGSPITVSAPSASSTPASSTSIHSSSLPPSSSSSAPTAVQTQWGQVCTRPRYSPRVLLTAVTVCWRGLRRPYGLCGWTCMRGGLTSLLQPVPSSLVFIVQCTSVDCMRPDLSSR